MQTWKMREAERTCSDLFCSIDNWDVSHLVYADYMLSRSSYTFPLIINGWNLTSIESYTHMFSGILCSNLTNIQLPNGVSLEDLRCQPNN